MPASMLVHADTDEVRHAAIRLFSVAAVRPAEGFDFRVSLKKADESLRAERGSSLLEVLYAALGRLPRNLKQEREQLSTRSATTVSTLGARETGIARDFLERVARDV